MTTDKCPACGANPIECGCEPDDGMIETHRAERRPVVMLLSDQGAVLFTFHTDRADFAPFATWDRDRMFRLEFAGDLAARAGYSCPVPGAIYVEVQPWRISMRTIDTPKPPRRPRRSATIFQFPSVQS